MSIVTADEWLMARADGVPPRLLARMRSALGEIEPARPISSALGEAAVLCLNAALASTADRSGALDLLAADALLTAGCEAAADEDVEAVARFAADYGAARLGNLLHGP